MMPPPPSILSVHTLNIQLWSQSPMDQATVTSRINSKHIQMEIINTYLISADITVSSCE